MERNRKVAVVAAIAIVAVIAGIALAENFGDQSKVLTAKVTKAGADNTLVLDISMEDFGRIGAGIGDDILVETKDYAYTVLLSPTQSYKGIPAYGGFIVDDSGKVTLGFSRCEHVDLDIKVGDVLTLSREGRSQYIDKIPNYLKGYTFDPKDYDDMIEFSNFREARGGDLMPDYIYRSASPWNAVNRSPYADEYHRDHGTEFMICLNMDEEGAAKYAEKNPDAYASGLFREGKVRSQELHSSIHTYPHECEFVIEAFLEAEGKIGIFCMYGKDRTGFHCAILEGLAGATYDEILDDFMESICNYYHIVKGSEEYETVSKMYPERVFYLFAHYDLIPHPEKIDWDSVVFEKFDPEEVFTKYLVDFVGIDADAVQDAKEKLTGGLPTDAIIDVSEACLAY